MAQVEGESRNLDRILTLPNAFSVVRLLMVGVLIGLALAGLSQVFLVCFVASLLTDFFDGLLARKLHQESRLGSQLDSWADIMTALMMPFCVWLLWREIVIREAPFIIVGLVSYVVPAGLGLIKYGRLPSYHTWGAKVCTVVMGACVVILLAGWSPWPFRLFVPVVVLEAAQEVAMTLILPEWHPNIPSLWHAIEIGRRVEKT